jgi:hypothetical protein
MHCFLFKTAFQAQITYIHIERMGFHKKKMYFTFRTMQKILL